MNHFRRRFLGALAVAPVAGPAAVKAAAADLAAVGSLGAAFPPLMPGDSRVDLSSATQSVGPAEYLLQQRRIVSHVAGKLGIPEDEALAAIRDFLAADNMGELGTEEPAWAQALKSPAAWWHRQKTREARLAAYALRAHWHDLLSERRPRLFPW